MVASSPRGWRRPCARWAAPPCQPSLRCNLPLRRGACPLASMPASVRHATPLPAGQVDRRHFIRPDMPARQAYTDEALPIGFSQTISAPHMHAGGCAARAHAVPLPLI